MDTTPTFCWCCGLSLLTTGECALCDDVRAACDPPHECMKRGGQVIGMCHDDVEALDPEC